MTYKGPSLGSNRATRTTASASPALTARRSGLTLSLLVAALVLFSCFSIPAHAAPGWSIVPSPNAPGAIQSNLIAVWCTSGTNCFATGRTDTSSGALTLTERWDGSAWSIVPSPNPAGTVFAQLSDVSCISATDCFAVGGSAGGFGHRTLIEHWDGSAWSIVPSPNPSGTTDAGLNGVSCISATDCFAVGGAFSSVTLIEHWDGDTWSIVPSPNPASATFSQLIGVSCVSATSCFAVGEFFTEPFGGGAVIERWDGTGWSLVPTPAGTGLLEAVSCVSATSCFAVGGDFSSTLTERWDGSAWSIVPSPTPAAAAGMVQLFDVSCVSSTQCFAVGFFDTNAGGLTLVERLHGRTWSIVPSANPAGESFSELLGVSCTRVTSCFAVGHSRSTLTERP